MQDNTFFQLVFQSLLTTWEANTLIESIDNTLHRMYTINQHDLLSHLKQNLNQSLASSLEQTLMQNNISGSNLAVLQTFLEKLEVAIKSCDVVGLTIAIPSTQEVIEHIAETVKALYGSTTILEINSDKTILGGAIVTHQGKYADRSIKTKLDTYFKTQIQ